MLEKNSCFQACIWIILGLDRDYKGYVGTRDIQGYSYEKTPNSSKLKRRSQWL